MALTTFFSVGIKKKLVPLSNKKGYDDLRPWIKSICNHLYWAALSSNGNGRLVVAKWLSLAGHVQNIHEHDDELFPKCFHPPIENTPTRKKFLKPSMHFVHSIPYYKML